MIFFEKSELPFSKCPTKNYITPSPELMSISLKIRTSITPPPPPIYIPITTLRMFFFLSKFLYLKITDKAQLCTGKIGIIPILTSTNIENRP